MKESDEVKSRYRTALVNLQVASQHATQLMEQRVISAVLEYTHMTRDLWEVLSYKEKTVWIERAEEAILAADKEWIDRLHGVGAKS